MSGPYRRVSTEENSSRFSYPTSPTSPSNPSSSTNTTTTTPPSLQKTKSERLSDKIQALLWVSFSLLTARFTNTPTVFLSDTRVIRPLFNLGIVLFLVNTTLCLYLAVYLPHVKKLKDPAVWNVYCPRVIPIMTGCGVLCGFCFVRSTWPVWGFLSPIILGVEFLGGLFLTHFIPWL